MTDRELSVVVFAYNEEINIAAVLGELRGWLAENEPRAEIVFVDDGSIDGTSREAALALRDFPHRIVNHAWNRGIGAALKSGVLHSQGAWVTFLPADGQIDPAAIGTLRAEQARTDSDVVLSVYDHRDDGFDRKLLSHGVRALIRIVHGVRLESDGPYLFRRSIFDIGQLKPNTFFLNFEFPIRVLAAGLRTSTVTIACRPRRAGTSKSTQWYRILGVAKDLLDLRMRRWTRG